MRRLALILWAMVGPVAAQDLNAFLVREGCAIGPPVLERARAAGFNAEDLLNLATNAAQSGQATHLDGWWVLSPELCRIEPQVFETELTPDAPEFGWASAYPGVDAPCAVPNVPLFVPTLARSRGWSEDRAYREYLAFLASRIAAGEITFYSDDILATPTGPQWMTGESCGDLPDIAAMRASQDWLRENTDPLLRAAMQSLPCEGGTTVLDVPQEALDALGIRKVENAWVLMELVFISIGSGWYEGHGPSDKGTARPPLCNPALTGK